MVSLYDLVVAVAANLHDLVEGVTDTGATALAEMRDQARGVEIDGRYNGSEILFREPAAQLGGMTGTTPFGVVDFARRGGVFQLSGNWSQSSGVPSGMPYVMLNLGGRGYPTGQIVRALQLANEALAIRSVVADESLAWVPGQYDYPIPSQYDTIENVWVGRAVNGAWRRQPLRLNAADGYTVIPALRLISLRLGLIDGDVLGLVGERRVGLPVSFSDADAIDLPVEPHVNGAIEYLDRAGTGDEQQIAAAQYADRLRTVPLYRRPNSIFLPPATV